MIILAQKTDQSKMTFRRIFANTNPAPTFEIAHARVLSLYREWLREIARCITKYPLEISVGEGRARIRHEFEKYRQINDLSVLNVMLLKGTQELIETHNKWKQKTHLMRYFEGEWEDQMRQFNPIYQPVKVNSLPNTSSFLSNFLTKRN